MTTKELSKIFKALSNENRLILFIEIYEKEKISVEEDCACMISEIACKLKIGAPTVSHHIKELEGCGLIHTQKVGKQITASINKEVVDQLTSLFQLKVE